MIKSIHNALAGPFDVQGSFGMGFPPSPSFHVGGPGKFGMGF